MVRRGLPRTRAGERHPSVERGSTAPAACARSDPSRRGRARNHIAEADIFVAYEPRKAYSVRLTFALVRLVATRLLFLHGIIPVKSIAYYIYAHTSIRIGALGHDLCDYVSCDFLTREEGAYPAHKATAGAPS